MGLVFQSNQDLIEQNEGLKAQIIDLKADQKIYENAKRENEVLRELLSSSGKVKAEFTHAEILAISNNIARKIVIINKGSSDDVYDGQAVVDAYGVFGHVIKAHKFTSSVLLITDKDSYVPVQNSKGARAIVTGFGDRNELEMLDATATTKFKVGQKLYTSGLALRYMQGYPVGVIKSISYNDKFDFVKVKIDPLAHLDQSRQLLLVWLPQNKVLSEAREFHDKY